MVEADVASGQDDKVPSQCFDEWDELLRSPYLRLQWSMPPSQPLEENLLRPDTPELFGKTQR